MCRTEVVVDVFRFCHARNGARYRGVRQCVLEQELRPARNLELLSPFRQGLIAHGFEYPSAAEGPVDNDRHTEVNHPPEYQKLQRKIG